MRRLVVTSLALLAAVLARAAPALADGEPASPRRAILIIVAASSPVQDVPLEELRRIFSAESRNFVPLNLPPGSAERVGLDLLLLGRGPEDVARYWIDRKIRGQGSPPRVIPSAALVAKIVARVPSTMGYVLVGPLPAGVKVLRVGGLVHTDPRYPLFLRGRSR